MAEQTRDYYRTLGVDRHASAGEIKGSYRRLALRYHPDRNPGDRTAEDRFKEVSEAYAVLADADRRLHYDRFGVAAEETPFGLGTDFSSATDFFDAILGDLFGLDRKRRAGQDLRYTLELTFEEAALGCERAITFDRAEDCRHCAGTGAEGGVSGLRACEACDGKGRRRKKAAFFAARRECPTCGGTGEVPLRRCKACLGSGLEERKREYTVRVPPGSVAGSAQRIPGEGSPGRRGGPAGDLHVLVRVKPHPFFRVEGGVLVCDVPITYAQAALGTEIQIPVLDGAIRMKIPPGTQSGSIFRVRGKGLPTSAAAMTSLATRGELHVKLQVEVPINLSSAAKKLLGELQDGLLGMENHPRNLQFQSLQQVLDAESVAREEPSKRDGTG